MRLIALMMLAALSSANAADEITSVDLDFTQVLKAPDGTDLQECGEFLKADAEHPDVKPSCIKYVPIQLGNVAYAALQKSKPGSMDEAGKRWRLSQKIYKKKAILTKPEVVILMNAISSYDGFPLEYVGQSLCMLDSTYCKDKD